MYIMKTGDCHFPVLWASKKQGSVARSTTEAEVIALAAALFGEALNLHSLAEHMTETGQPSCFGYILQKGYSSRLRHCGRVHRVNIASCHEQLVSGDAVAEYCISAEQRANGFTKVISPQHWPDTLRQMCLFESIS